MLRPTALLLLAALAAGCDSGSPAGYFATLSQNPAALVGIWDWERDSSYWTGRRMSDTPVSTGRTETLTFSPDGTLTVHRNGVMELETAFAVEDDGSGATRLLNAGAFGRYVFGTRGRTLVIYVELLADGPERVYRRRR